MKTVVNSQQMKKCDSYTIEQLHVPSMVLMERAALSVVEEIERQNIDAGKTLVICGLGNNGGDGFAIARMLFQKGKQVTVVCNMQEEKASVQNKQQFEILQRYGVKILKEFPDEEFTLVIDAIFGVGLTRDIEGIWQDWILKMNAMNAYKVAVDIPSGVEADNAQVLGCAFEADLTVTFAYPKVGLLLFPGYSYAGKVVVKDIGIDAYSWKDEQPNIFTYEKEDIRVLPRRKRNSNKGTYGKVLVVAGTRNMAGAAYFSAKAAAMIGCGLVKVLTSEVNRTTIHALMPEAVLDTWEENALNELEEKVKSNLQWADVVVVGPGLGTGDIAQKTVEYVLKYAKVPCVIDADGLNILAKNRELLNKLPKEVILTPHMGEMARLTGLAIETLKKDALTAAGSFSKETNTICVLKDARTIVALPDDIYYINTSGNQGMATAGAGDVLTGVVAGLIAQGIQVGEAAAFGVFLHGMSGDVMVKETGYYSMQASDILEGIKKITRKES